MDRFFAEYTYFVNLTLYMELCHNTRKKFSTAATQTKCLTFLLMRHTERSEASPKWFCRNRYCVPFIRGIPR